MLCSKEQQQQQLLAYDEITYMNQTIKLKQFFEVKAFQGAAKQV